MSTKQKPDKLAQKLVPRRQRPAATPIRKVIPHRIEVGIRLGKLVIIGGPSSRRHSGKMIRYYRCRCDCGNEREITEARLGRMRSCGCGPAASPWLRHGESGTRLHKVWVGIRYRCEKEGHKDFARYGGRGIRVCEEWSNSYETFRDWAIHSGYTPELSIDRIDVDGNYEPFNCRWITNAEQQNNRTDTLWLTAYGETRSSAQWARDSRCVVSAKVLRGRIKAGWAVEAALATPPLTHRQRGTVRRSGGKTSKRIEEYQVTAPVTQ